MKQKQCASIGHPTSRNRHKPPIIKYRLLVAQYSFGSGAGGLRFKSRVGQIGSSVVNGFPPLRHFFDRGCVACMRNDAEMGPGNSLHALAYYR